MSIIELLQAPTDLGSLERVFTPDDVGGQVAWQMLVRDGALTPLFGDTALAAGVTSTPELRAKSVGLSIPELGIVENYLAVAGLAAAWIWVGGTLPTITDIIYTLVPPRNLDPSVRLRSSAYASNQVTAISGLWVTNLDRTARDVALWADPELAVPVIGKLTTAGANVEKVQDLLERPGRLVNRPAARKILREAVGGSGDELCQIL